MLEANNNKKNPMSKNKEDATKQSEGHNHNIILYPPGGQPTDWRTIIPKQESHCCKGSETHIRLPSLGIQQREWEYPGNLTFKASRI